VFKESAILTDYGTGIWAPALLLSALAAGLSFYIWWPLGVLFLLLFAFLAHFFRDPRRVKQGGVNAVISPADGRVVEIADVTEPDYIGGEATKIAIFMTLLDCHVNRMPRNVRIDWARHRPGKFLKADDPAASMENEQTLIAARDEADNRPILLKQIAGLVARRIVCPVESGQFYGQGQRFGMIRFGSRVELFLAKDAAFRLRVRLGDKVYAGRTVLGEWP
jgi:phosphatidylserine decarboxylase